MRSILKSKIVCIVAALAVFSSGTYADAGILFGEGGLFQQMRMNRMARVSARMSARNQAGMFSGARSYRASYGTSYGCANCAVSTGYTSVRSYGSNGATQSYGSNGAQGRYQVLPVTRSYGSEGGYGSTGAAPQYRTTSGCIIDPETGRLVCPLGAVKNTKCNNPNCNCENCDCENCECGKESLVGVAAPLIKEEVSLVGKKAPEIKQQTAYASL